MTQPNPTITVDIEQLQHLQNIAQHQGSSLNETLYEVIDLGINALQHRKQKRLAALNRLTQMRQNIAPNQEKYPVNLLGSIREERIQQISLPNSTAL